MAASCGRHYLAQYSPSIADGWCCIAQSAAAGIDVAHLVDVAEQLAENTLKLDDPNDGRERQKPGALRRELDCWVAKLPVQHRRPDLKHTMGASR